MPDAYRSKLERRIRHSDISGVAFLFLIFSLVFSFLFLVLSFDYLLKPKPSVMLDLHVDPMRSSLGWFGAGLGGLGIALTTNGYVVAGVIVLIVAVALIFGTVKSDAPK